MSFHLKAVSTPIQLIRFEVGKNYTHKYIGDSNLFTTYKVLSRTKCFLKIQEQFKTKNKPICLQKPVIILRVKIFNYQGVEHCHPVGKFAKCPILSAEQTNEN
tara:strand:+ start:1562 stop:1870 length:309 start_codon:yes stop_codon:yes gene_type:complete